jgi:hypothetical protein
LTLGGILVQQAASTAWAYHVADAPAAHQLSDHRNHPFVRAKQGERAMQAVLLRDIFGNTVHSVAISPSWLRWNGGTIRSLAQAIYDERVFTRLPVLGDALEEAGCDDLDILRHCRGPGPHVRGCWLIDLLLGKE